MTTRTRITLLVLLLFGVPAFVTTAMLSSNLRDEVADGAQPGGALHGEARDEAKHPIEGLDVSVAAVAKNGVRASSSTTRTDGAGAFRVDVPPVDGRYEITAGGGDWIEQRVDVSRVDRQGRALADKPIELTMKPASRLDLEFVRTDGRPPGNGTYELTAVSNEGLFPGWTGASIKRTGSFEGGKLDLAGLAPMRVRILTRMASGERVDLVLDLASGRNHHKVEL